MYSDDGIWDLLGIHIPVFFIRDPMLFPSLAHASKKNPVTNIKVRIIFELQLWNIHSLKQILPQDLSYYFPFMLCNTMIITTSAILFTKPCRLGNIAGKYTSVTSQPFVYSSFSVKVISKHSSNYDTFVAT